MKYTDYVQLPYDSYDSWRASVISNGFDVDNVGGCLSLDLANEFWWNIGFPAGYPFTNNTLDPYQVWTYASQNASWDGTQYFELISDKTQIKRGDIIVCNTFGQSPTGQIGFADEAYNGSNTITLLSQDNGGTPDPAGGSYVNVANYSLEYFLGAFRYREWHVTPPPVTRHRESRLPLILLTRMLKNGSIL